MYKVLKHDITKELEKLEREHPEEYEQLKKSWILTTKRKKKQEPTRLLIPFIGSGLDALAEGGISSWKQLVSSVKDAVSSPWSKHIIDTADLSKPQELESYLANCKDKKDAMKRVHETFKKHFSIKYSPSSFHKRLIELFPYIITTNYDDIMSYVKDSPESFDLTDPKIESGDPFKLSKAIIHLHGKWNKTLTSEQQINQIFWGVGPGPIKEDRCLILTEHQYHRFYSQSTRFQQAINRVLSNEHLLLFLGSGLTRDEFGIHHILRDLQTIGRIDFVGIYIGFNLNPMKIEMLRGRGILSISLPKKFGYKHETIKVVLHTLFDIFEEKFNTTSNVDNLKRDIEPIEVLCSGLSSRQKVFALNDEPRKETSNWIRKDKYCEEPGGQHLLPALNLVYLGHKIALCTRLGDDDDGNWILRQMERFVQNIKGKGDIDTQLVLRKGTTRLTYVITYPDGKKIRNVQPGTREIFDYEATVKGSHSNWLNGKEDRNELLKIIKRFNKVKALYLGPYGLDIQNTILKELSNAKYRFLETGTSGGTRLNEMLSIANKFTHIIASAEFIYKVLKKEIKNGRKTDFQKNLFDEIQKNTSFINDTYEIIWGKNGEGVLVVTLGCYGSVYLEKFDGKIQLVELSNINTEPQICWIGCGDMFRSEFIHAILKGKPVKEACQAGNKAAYEKTKRMSFLSNPIVWI